MMAASRRCRPPLQLPPPWPPEEQAMIGRNPISRFAALAMGGIVVLTLAWTLAAGWLAVPVSGMSKWVLENAANGWVQRVDLETPRNLVVNSSVQVSNEQTGWRRAEAIVEVDPARYGYGLPVLVAMLLAAWGPGRWWRILVGYVALLPLQTFSVVSQVLMQLCLAARLDLNVLGIQTWQLEAIVYAYQMGGLMVPTLCPVLHHRLRLSDGRADGAHAVPGAAVAGAGHGLCAPRAAAGLEPQPRACRRAPAHGGAQALGLAPDRWCRHLHRPSAGVLQQRGHPAQGQGHQRHAAALKAVRGRLQPCAGMGGSRPRSVMKSITSRRPLPLFTLPIT